MADVPDGRRRADARPGGPLLQLRAGEDPPTRSSAIRTRPSGSTGCWTGGWARASIIAGDYSIADIATWPWTKNPAAYDQNPDDFPHVKAWLKKIGERPTVKRALRVLDA